MTSNRPKVFGIGFHKTATSSLGEALQLLGYRVASVVGIRDRDIAETYKDKAFDLVPDFDAFEDNPWPLLYRELDQAFPQSKFILTRRPDAAWLKSATNHFGGHSTPMRELIYGGHGDPAGNEDIYLARYRRHNEEVMDYFADRPKDLLVMDITAGDGWEVLCPFLSHDPPQFPFPAANSAQDRARKRGMLGRIRRFFGA